MNADTMVTVTQAIDRMEHTALELVREALAERDKAYAERDQARAERDTALAELATEKWNR